MVLENCFRSKDKKLHFKDAALVGARGVAGSIVASTITTVVVYLPLCLQDGLAGQIFWSVGLYNHYRHAGISGICTYSGAAVLLDIPAEGKRKN